jgi:hypothetical protein
MFTVMLPDKSAIDLFVPEELFENKADKEIVEWFIKLVRQRWDIETL